MRLNTEQRIEIILGTGSGSSRMAASAINRKHGTNITHDTVAKLIGNVKKSELLQIKPDAGKDVQPAMKVQQLRCSLRLHGVPKKLYVDCLQKVVSANEVSAT